MFIFVFSCFFGFCGLDLVDWRLWIVDCGLEIVDWTPQGGGRVASPILLKMGCPSVRPSVRSFAKIDVSLWGSQSRELAYAPRTNAALRFF